MIEKIIIGTQNALIQGRRILYALLVTKEFKLEDDKRGAGVVSNLDL